jgi:hypothetical protein
MKTKYIVGGGILIVILLLLLKKKKAVVTDTAVDTNSGASSGGSAVAPSQPINNMPDTSQLTNQPSISPNPLDNSGNSKMIDKQIDATTMPVENNNPTLVNPNALAPIGLADLPMNS